MCPHPADNEKPGLVTRAGWSSPVARQAHNLKVGGSNPPPATTLALPGVHRGSNKPRKAWSAIRVTIDKFGRLDVLHNNAGGSTAQDDTAVNAPLEEFWRAIKLDLYGTFLGCRFGIPELIKAGGGSVINMSSNVALMGVPGRDCYTAAKGGIAAITRFLAVAYAPQKVRVNAIAPSATMTERVRNLITGNAALTRLADSHLLGLIEPDDIASMALYLASDESRMVTGQVLPVDSGVTIS